MRARYAVTLLVALALLLTACGAQQPAAKSSAPATAPEPKAKLKAYSAFAENHFTNTMFMQFLKALGERGFEIQWVGGPEAIPAANAVEPLKKGIIELVHLPGSYIADQIPATLFDSIYQGDEDKIYRATGIEKVLDDVMNKSANAHMLGFIAMAQPFSLGGNKKITAADFKGLRIRAGGPFNDFVEGLGGATVRLAASERYIGLEKGLIDLAMAPTTNFQSEKLFEVSKYLIYPPVLDARNGFYINLDAYNRLTANQKKVLEDTAREFEKKARDFFMSEQKKAEQFLAGKMETVNLPPAEATKLLKAAEDGTWKYITSRDPVNGKKLSDLADKAGLGKR